jgi:hypothetical protein
VRSQYLIEVPGASGVGLKPFDLQKQKLPDLQSQELLDFQRQELLDSQGQ